jgi:hypothetical protein
MVSRPPADSAFLRCDRLNPANRRSIAANGMIPLTCPFSTSDREEQDQEPGEQGRTETYAPRFERRKQRKRSHRTK